LPNTYANIHMGDKVKKITHGRGYIYSIQYHIVWCVKYRHEVLKSNVEEKLKELLYEIAIENNFTIITIR
jgi:putative transposase